MDTRKLAYNYAVYSKKPIPTSWESKKLASEDWLKGFRKRRENLSLRTPEPTSIARSMSFNKINVMKFFENLKCLFEKFSCNPSRIFNLDETALSTVQKPSKVLCWKGLKQVGKIVACERGTMVTMCCCVNTVGISLPPVYIFP